MTRERTGGQSGEHARERRTWGAAEKLAILRSLLIEKVPISDLCDRHGMQPSQVYQWQALLFAHGAAAFERKVGRQASADLAKDRKIAQLEAKLAQKHEVISELMEANVREKKANGEL
jgi:transposase-like protein